ncbi:hypothetical protein SAM23877_6727 [Streptomyces ambofaciens ATCC 23877]|uniref:Uncharacterized protein n=2 Tax=Streptomyces ambofaciens TaxID=1889 RepID=A0ADK3_STRA7|nr:hypothetical protein [Streptomyces ambofaciens]AKZ59772.1 hypothetical protein SAM23877_6727 [Streptomyces ambofaciens ATCC 23877]ANB10012.1 hypothetical protein SAM40697_6059 [Streptomyces ambofaciens]CAJ88559.1 conserved hypothetical protein [Streptomyces ambofaciens ATCC 23877]
MTDHRLEGPGETGEPVPRDMPDQQAGPGDDPWEAAAPTREQLEQGQRPEDTDADDGTTDTDEADADVPDTDEAGTGRRGAPHAGDPDHPVPDEPSG